MLLFFGGVAAGILITILFFYFMGLFSQINKNEKEQDFIPLAKDAFLLSSCANDKNKEEILNHIYHIINVKIKEGATKVSRQDLFWTDSSDLLKENKEFIKKVENTFDPDEFKALFENLGYTVSLDKLKSVWYLNYISWKQK